MEVNSETEFMEEDIFRLIKNDFINSGRCTYEDGYGNKIIMLRDQDGKGFSAKLKFADPGIKASRICVRIPVPDGAEGNTLHFEYQNGVDTDNDAFQSAVNGLRVMIDHWIDLHYAISRLGIPQEWYLRDNPDLDDETIGKERLDEIFAFPEIADIAMKEAVSTLK